MNIKKPWGVATAAILAVALVGGGMTSATAAEGAIRNPQSNGSPGSFFLYDAGSGERVDTDVTRTYMPNYQMIASASATDVLAEIDPVTVINDSEMYDQWVRAGKQVYRFLSKKNAADLKGGVNTWNAYAVDSAAGPNGGTLAPDMTLNSIFNGPGGIADDIASGGSFWYGVAYVINSGVTNIGSIYREIEITPGTGEYTVGPVEIDGPPVVRMQPESQSVVEGATATFTAAATATATLTVQWESNAGSGWNAVSGAISDTLTIPAVTRAQTGTQYRAVYTNAAGSATTNAATLTVTLAPPTEPVAGDAGEVQVADPAEGVTSIQIPVAAQYNGQSLTTWAWSTPSQLPNSAVANGVATVDITSLEAGEHTIALIDPATGDVIAWTAITVAQPSNVSETDLSVDVVTSNKFALEGVNAAVDLGEVKRGQTTVAAPLTPFTVTDDRATLPGWNLTASVDDFVNASANNDVIGKSALGLKPKQVGTGVAGVVLGTERVAGSADYAAALFAEGAADSSTGEAGTQFDADLTFAAPLSAKAGAYTSKLTLTLTSK